MTNKIFAGILALLALTLGSCVKEAPLLKDTSTIGAYLTYPGGAPSGPGRFLLANIETSTVSINVKGVGSPIVKVTIYVGQTSDKSTWKKIKTVPFADSATLSITGAELAAALGVSPDSFSPGDSFTFFNEAETADGRLFSAANTDGDFQGQNSYQMAFVWSANVFCTFDQSVFTGSFLVVRDDWADFNVGDPIAVTPGPSATQISITAYPSPAYGTNRKPIILDVDPETNAVTVAEQIYGDYPPVTNVTARGSGSVNSCSGTITLNLTHKYGGSDYEGNVLILQK